MDTIKSDQSTNVTEPWSSAISWLSKRLTEISNLYNKEKDTWSINELASIKTHFNLIEKFIRNKYKNNPELGPLYQEDKIEEEIFRNRLFLVEKAFGNMQKNYCQPFLKSISKTPDQFIQYINSKPHSLERMLGLILQDIYKFPELAKAKYSLEALKPIEGQKFTSADEFINIPEAKPTPKSTFTQMRK